jgi:hypothetical protein
LRLPAAQENIKSVSIFLIRSEPELIGREVSQSLWVGLRRQSPFAHSDMRGTVTGAIETAVVGADATALHEFATQGCARSMSADGGVAGSNSLPASVVGKSSFVEVDLANERCVLRGQTIERAGDAFTGGFEEDRCGFRHGLKLAGAAFEGCCFRSATAVAVDDRVAEDAIEPGYRGLVFAQFAAGFESADIGALQNVFCERWIADPVGNEAEEFSAKIEQCVE